MEKLNKAAAGSASGGGAASTDSYSAVPPPPSLSGGLLVGAVKAKAEQGGAGASAGDSSSEEELLRERKPEDDAAAGDPAYIAAITRLTKAQTILKSHYSVYGRNSSEAAEQRAAVTRLAQAVVDSRPIEIRVKIQAGLIENANKKISAMEKVEADLTKRKDELVKLLDSAKRALVSHSDKLQAERATLVELTKVAEGLRMEHDRLKAAELATRPLPPSGTGTQRVAAASVAQVATLIDSVKSAADLEAAAERLRDLADQVKKQAQDQKDADAKPKVKEEPAEEGAAAAGSADGVGATQPANAAAMTGALSAAVDAAAAAAGAGASAVKAEMKAAEMAELPPSEDGDAEMEQAKPKRAVDGSQGEDGQQKRSKCGEGGESELLESPTPALQPPQL